MADRQERQQSIDYDSDPESPNGLEDGNSDKTGRKRNPHAQAARRDQNRIAQREFRLRKQQRIRDLEARVEILSGTKDQTFTEIREICQELMKENHQLRHIIRSLGDFIGNGAGFLRSLGWEQEEFKNFINKAETDTAFAMYAQKKKQRMAGQTSDGTSPSPSASAAPDLGEPSNKRPRTSYNDSGGVGVGESSRPDDRTQYPMIMPMNTAMYSLNRSMDAQQNYTGAAQAGSPLMMSSGAASTPSVAPQQYGSPTPSFPSTLQQALSMPMDPGIQPGNYVSGSELGNPQIPDEVEDDPKLLEAGKLINYHLENYKRNNAYVRCLFTSRKPDFDVTLVQCLPASLRPTLVQRTVPHEAIIDGIPHPDLRDRMILLRGRYTLVDVMSAFREAVRIHGDDVLAHHNWELSEHWLRTYGFLVDTSTLNITNKWRRERGERELSMAEVAPREEGTPVG